MTGPHKNNVNLEIEIPGPEAADLTSKAAAKGVPTPEYLGYHALRSAYGFMHPRVVAFERAHPGNDRDEEGLSGDEDDDD